MVLEAPLVEGRMNPPSAKSRNPRQSEIAAIMALASEAGPLVEGRVKISI